MYTPVDSLRCALLTSVLLANIPGCERRESFRLELLDTSFITVSQVGDNVFAKYQEGAFESQELHVKVVPYGRVYPEYYTTVETDREVLLLEKKRYVDRLPQAPEKTYWCDIVVEDWMLLQIDRTNRTLSTERNLFSSSEYQDEDAILRLVSRVFLYKPLNASAVSTLQILPNLRLLVVGLQEINPESLDSVLHFPTLKTLDIRRAIVPDEALQIIAKDHGTVEVILNRRQAGNPSLRGLKRIKVAEAD